MKIKANAKINIALKVVGTRENGYHDLDMIMVPIGLYDVIDIEVLSDEYETNVEFDDYSIPLGPKNTINKAIELLRDKYHFKEEFDVYVEKGIPSEAGLGGGSSDAAFVLKAIVDLLKLPASEEELIEIGKKIGADVPFFIKNSPARVTGIGEYITPFELENKPGVLLVKPFIGCSTKEVFKEFDLAKENQDGDILKAIEALQEGKLEQVQKYRLNDLEKPAIKFLSDIQKIIKNLKDDGFEVVGMSGSGSTVFALSNNRALLLEKSKYYKQKGYYVVLTSII